MKKITQMVWTAVLLLTMIVVSFCNARANQPPQDENSNIEARLAKQDSLCEKIKQGFDGLSLSLDTLGKETADLKLRVEKLEQQVEKGNSNTWCIVAIAILFCILIVCMIFIHTRLEKFAEKKALKDIKDEIKSLRDGDVPKTANVYSKQSPTIEEFKNLSSCVEQMKQRMNEMKQDMVRKVENTSVAHPLPSEPVVVSSKIMYAPLNSNGYFTELFPSSKEGCIFKVYLKSDTEGEFSILSLDKLQSYDGWEEVVEYDGAGSCSINQAKHFRLSSLGKCEKIDGIWQITEKLKIKIWK